MAWNRVLLSRWIFFYFFFEGNSADGWIACDVQYLDLAQSSPAQKEGASYVEAQEIDEREWGPGASDAHSKG